MTSHRDDAKEHGQQLDRRAMTRWLGAGLGGAAVALTLQPEEAHATNQAVLDANTIADLRALPPPLIGASARVVLGYFNVGDGGGGLFCWDPGSSVTDNGGTVIKPNSVSPLNPGRWLRIFEGPVSVKWFGAGLGGDDAQAIQNALDSVSNSLEANPKGGEVFVPKGLYVLNKSLIIHSNCRLTGEGWASTLKAATNMDPLGSVRPVIRNLHFFLPTGNSNIQIANLAIDGNNQNNPFNFTYQAGIFLQYCKDILVENVYVHHCPLVGITFVNCERGVLHASKMSANDSLTPNPGEDNAMGFQGQESKQIKVTNCHSEYNERYGFQFWDPAFNPNADQSDNVIANCTTTGNQGNAYSFTRGRRNKIINCSSIADAGGPILAETDDAEVSGCTVVDPTYTSAVGINLLFARRTRLIGNSIRNTNAISPTNAYGIAAQDSPGSVVEGNIITNILTQTQGAAILFGNNCADSIIANNVIQVASHIGIQATSDRTSIVSNQIKACGNNGIHISESPKYIAIIGNHVSDCTNPAGSFVAGIYVGKNPAVPGPEFHRIENNLLVNNFSAGIRLDAVTRCVVSGNAIRNDQVAQPLEYLAIWELRTSPLVPAMDNLVIGNQCFPHKIFLYEESFLPADHNVPDPLLPQPPP